MMKIVNTSDSTSSSEPENETMIQWYMCEIKKM